jgi:hypothetical protein
MCTGTMPSNHCQTGTATKIESQDERRSDEDLLVDEGYWYALIDAINRNLIRRIS